MSPEQFDLVADLIRSRGPAREAARLVLVEGLRKVDAGNRVREQLHSKARASRAAGPPPIFSPASVNNAVTRILAAHAKIEAVYAAQLPAPVRRRKAPLPK